jgi:hypothetical protein
MPSPDTAKAIADALYAAWADTAGPDYHQGWKAVVHVEHDYQPLDGYPTLLVADDGGPPMLPGAWLFGRSPRRPTIRLTAFAAGRDDAWAAVNAALGWLIANHRTAGVTRIEDASETLTTRDRATGAYLASITMPCIVRPIPAA